MRNIKKNFSVQIALAIILLASINISAMFTGNQPLPQPQTEQSKPFGLGGGFGNRSQPQATTPTFGSKSSQPQPQSQMQQTPNFGGFGNRSQPEATTPPFGSISNQPTTGFNFGKTSQPQTTPFELKTPIQQQTSPQISNTPLLQVYFNPQDQLKITSTLFDLLDNAKKQIYIAMYWITDPTVIEKIIAAKRRNIDIQIIIDGSSLEYFDITPQLLQNNIVPIIYPSNDATGKMHHKFVTIDGIKVFTGSANFTKAALDEKIQRFNFENVVVINSTHTAKQYIDAFMNMKKQIFNFYVQIIALNNPNQLPDWMSDLIPTIYQTQDLMQQSVNQEIKNYNAEEQRRINNFFGMQSTERREDNMTMPQKRLLNMNGFSDQDLLGLSKKEASDLITKVKSGYWDPATKKQRALLKSKGFSDQEILFLSKEEASDLISQVLNSGKQQYRW
jgi:hypothetical protein